MHSGAGPDRAGAGPWLEAVLARNAGSAYLRQFGAPRDLESFRQCVPLTTYDELRPWLDRLCGGEADLLFAGRPQAFERTGGSAGGAKLIPYTGFGLADFQAALAPWLASTVARHQIQGRVYLATSPATRPPEVIAGVPLGLPDGAYLGPSWGAWVGAHSAVALELAQETRVEVWRERTLQGLRAASDLELISVWSPTFLLRLLDDLPDPHALWPRLKLVSCWASAASRGPADELRRRLPQAHVQAKGLVSTECVVTVPDAADVALLDTHGFFEFERGGEPCLAHELRVGDIGEVIATTASGLYRYRTGDRVRCTGMAGPDRPALEFVGRCGIASDLVGEKLVEAFVAEVLADAAAWCFLTPHPDGRGYVLVADEGTAVDLPMVESRLERNPQYAHARRMGQLRPLALRRVARLHDRHVQAGLARGVRFADVKPLALMPQVDWLDGTWEPR